MARSLACWFGRHTWVTRTYEGDTYRVCAVCWKTPRGEGDGKRPSSSGDPHLDPGAQPHQTGGGY